MKRLIAFVLAGVTTCFGADLKVKLSSGPIAASTVTGAQAGRGPNTCRTAQCVSLAEEDNHFEQVMYVHGSSQRIEFKGTIMSGGPTPAFAAGRAVGDYHLVLPHMAVITHCDTGQVIELDLDSHEYREFKQPKYPGEKNFQKEVERARKDAGKISSSTVDTGETKELWGRDAKHQITTIKHTSRGETQQEVVDGWYIDMPEPGCAPDYMRQGRLAMVTFDGPNPLMDIVTDAYCPRGGGDWYGYRAYSTLLWGGGHFIPVGYREVTRGDSELFWDSFSTCPIYVGFTPQGWAVEEKISDTVTTGPLTQGKDRTQVSSAAGASGLTEVQQPRQRTWQTSVTELSESPLDPALFEVPAGFVKVKQLYQHTHLLEKVSGK